MKFNDTFNWCKFKTASFELKISSKSKCTPNGKCKKSDRIGSIGQSINEQRKLMHRN